MLLIGSVCTCGVQLDVFVRKDRDGMYFAYCIACGEPIEYFEEQFKKIRCGESTIKKIKKFYG